MKIFNSLLLAILSVSVSNAEIFIGPIPDEEVEITLPVTEITNKDSEEKKKEETITKPKSKFKKVCVKKECRKIKIHKKYPGTKVPKK